MNPETRKRLPEEVLADTREDAARMRRRGHAHDAALLEQVCDDMADALEDYLNWLSEDEARLRGGHTTAFLRARFPGWLAQGMARWHPHGARKRQYRAVIIPQRPNRDAARAAGQRAVEPEHAAS